MPMSSQSFFAKGYNIKAILKHVFTALSSVLIIYNIVSCNLTGKPETNIAMNHTPLSGAGSTFANPIYTKMIDEYRGQTGVETVYQPIGSSAGIKKLMTKSVDFAGSDAYLSNDDMAMFTSPVVEFPTCIGAVVLSYNLPGIANLKLTGNIISDIFLGKITKWNDAKIKAENKDANLPDQAITVVHRWDGSGTTYVFTDYLSKVSDEWRTKVGTAKEPNWPVGVAGKGSEGVAENIRLTAGAIGYVELTYALQKFMDFALIKNSTGKYIKASLESVSLAADCDIPADTRVSITNSPVEGAYPISSFTWIMVYKEQSYNNRSTVQAQDLVYELNWMIHNNGQKYTGFLNYAPLPPKAVAAAEKVIKSVTYGGRVVLQDEQVN